MSRARFRASHAQFRASHAQFWASHAQFRASHAQFRASHAQFRASHAQFRASHAQFRASHTQFRPSHAQFCLSHAQFRASHAQFRASYVEIGGFVGRFRAVRYIRAIVNPEFPSDNHELWSARPPPWNEETAPETAAEPESATETESESVMATEPESVPESEPEPEPVTAAATAPEPVAVPLFEVADFDDADFALAEEESRSAEAAPDAFQRFISTVVAVALAAGVPPRVAGAIPGMVGAARLDVQPLDPETLEALVAASLLARTDSGAVTRSAALVANAQAWRATLLGEETDLPVTEMLDEWSAGMVAALAKLPQQKESLRRELRARGIAAFGMLDAA